MSTVILPVTTVTVNVNLNIPPLDMTVDIPAGVWSYANWTKVGLYSASFAESTNGVAVFTGGLSHPAPWTGHDGSGSFSETIPATAAQIADINAAAGGTLSLKYGRISPDSGTTFEVISSLVLVLAGAPGGTSMTFERATVYEGAQLGVESTPGVPVAATKRLLGLEIDFDNMTNIKAYRPQGNKFNTASQVGKEWTDGKINGIQCYNDMLYLLSSWLTTTTPTVPVNNSAWNVTGASGPWGFTFKGSVLAPATYASAAAAQAAIAAMPSVGPGNVLVTGAAPAFKIKFIGGLGTDTSPITAPTGTPAPTIALDVAGTLTNRWKFVTVPSGPDTIQTYTWEKGAKGIANMAQQAAFAFVHGLSFKYSKNEASLTGGFAAQTSVDPFTMATAGVSDVPCVPINMKDVTIYAGTTLSNLAVLKRVFDFEFGVQNRASGLITLNANDPSFSNRIEDAPDLSVKFSQEHDAEGQAMLANLRNNVPLYMVIEALGPQIEAGFNYRLRWTMKVKNTKPTPGDVDGAYVKNYDGYLEYDSVLGTAIQCEVDSPLATLG